MNIVCQDQQVIGETTQQALQLFQQGPVNALVTMVNAGANPIIYDWQYWNGAVWLDMGALGTPFQNTLSSCPAVPVPLLIQSPYSQVRLMCSASGGSLLTFSILQYANRTSGGQIPLLNL